MNAESSPNARKMSGQQLQHEQTTSVNVDIYIAEHCWNCAYAYEVAAEIRQSFPHIQVRLIDLQSTTEPIPEAVFATPTYLLNGRVWSLGNPSLSQVHQVLSQFA